MRYRWHRPRRQCAQKLPLPEQSAAQAGSLAPGLSPASAWSPYSDTLQFYRYEEGKLRELAGGEAGTEESAWCPAARPFCSVLYSYMSTEMTPEETADPYSWKHGYPEGLHSYLFRTVDGNTLSTVSGEDFQFSVPAYFDEYVTFMEDSENRGSLRALFSETGHSVFFVGHTGGNYEEFSHGFTGGWPGASGGMTLLWRGEGDDLVRSVGGDGLAAINYETAEAAVENPLDSLHIMYTIFDDSDVLLYTFAYTGTGEGTQYPQYP